MCLYDFYHLLQGLFRQPVSTSVSVAVMGQLETVRNSNDMGILIRTVHFGGEFNGQCLFEGNEIWAWGNLSYFKIILQIPAGDRGTIGSAPMSTRLPLCITFRWKRHPCCIPLIERMYPFSHNFHNWPITAPFSLLVIFMYCSTNEMLQLWGVSYLLSIPFHVPEAWSLNTVPRQSLPVLAIVGSFQRKSVEDWVLKPWFVFLLLARVYPRRFFLNCFLLFWHCLSNTVLFSNPHSPTPP